MGRSPPRAPSQDAPSSWGPSRGGTPHRAPVDVSPERTYRVWVYLNEMRKVIWHDEARARIKR